MFHSGYFCPEEEVERLEDSRIGFEMNSRPGDLCISDSFEVSDGDTTFEALKPLFPIFVDTDFEPLGECIDDRCTYSMESS